MSAARDIPHPPIPLVVRGKRGATNRAGQDPVRARSDSPAGGLQPPRCGFPAGPDAARLFSLSRVARADLRTSAAIPPAEVGPARYRSAAATQAGHMSVLRAGRAARGTLVA